MKRTQTQQIREEQRIMVRKYGGIYVRYTANNNDQVITEKLPKKFRWLLLDQDNGNPELGNGYLWAFETVELAKEHLFKHLQNSNYSSVIGPFHRGHVTGDFLAKARFNFDKKVYSNYPKIWLVK